jgi:cyclopropane-fatty-acyl-phospholipid synthase
VRKMLAKRLVTIVMRRLPAGTLIVVDPDGGHHRYGSGPPEATIQLRSEAAWLAFLHGSLGLADAYSEGLWDSPDLVALVRLGARNMVSLDRVRNRLRFASGPLAILRALRRPADPQQNRRDIAAHYDLGNELFKRMLDPTLTYSCAIFDEPGMTLKQAQLAKLERVCEKLELGPSHRVIEIGTGWGSFAIYAAQSRGCQVTTTTISREQYEHVVKEVKRLGLSDRVTVLFEDYSKLSGRYDRLVSIEMIEAVGWRGWGTFLSKCSSLLEPNGSMLLQAITIDDRAYEVEKGSRSFIKEYIFPGGNLPSNEVLARNLSRRTDLQTHDLDDITEGYVETLRRWRESFEANSGELAELGYSAGFMRIWRLYLAYCEAGFAERRICDVQLLLTKPLYRSGQHASAAVARLVASDAG